MSLGIELEWKSFAYSEFLLISRTALGWKGLVYENNPFLHCVAEIYITLYISSSFVSAYVLWRILCSLKQIVPSVNRQDDVFIQPW